MTSSTSASIVIQFFFILLYMMALTLSVWKEYWSLTIQMNSAEQ